MSMETSGRRGQAAHEFLVTYGWTALVAIISIGIMAYFGAFNPGALAPERCSFPPEGPVECVKATASTDGSLRLLLLNKEGPLLLAGAECNFSGEQMITTRVAFADESPLPGRPWMKGDFITLKCLFEGDNPFAKKGGRPREVTATIRLIDPSQVEHFSTALVRVLVEEE